MSLADDLARDTSLTDPHLWLEDVTGDAAMGWVRERNAMTLARLASGEAFAILRDRLREVLDSADRIPYVTQRGGFLYNFWQDEANPRGLWRRTALAEYRKPDPRWEVLLDVDALAASENENWVWQGAPTLRAGGYRRALVHLSRGGADASVVREFDVADRAFVSGGFGLAEAKSDVGWIDAEHVYVGTDFGPGSMTSSGYPRIVRVWRRGTGLREAETVFEGEPADVSVSAYRDQTEGFERDFVIRAIDFYRHRWYLRSGGDLILVPVPEDAKIDVHREWLLIRTRSRWTERGREYPAGALLAAGFEEFMAGGRELTVLFEPDPHTSLAYHAWTRHHLILATMRDVRSALAVLTPTSEGWHAEPLGGLPELAETDVTSTDPHESDEYYVATSGFTEPTTLRLVRLGGAEPAQAASPAEPASPIKRAPAFFDASGLTVRQRFATSDDGTAIPYFVVGPDRPGPGPTLLTGYGGFEVSLTPSYSGVIGRGWLARGGSYVVANLRAGGEYGPDWHLSAIKENRHLVYEDFAAVARDLAECGVTTPGQLGIEGGSNGGLLMGVMLTRYPELFGAIVGQVPLLDMRRYHRLLAGASWIAEYGDPDRPDEWRHLLPFSPYQNVSDAGRYPPVLLITSTRDDRVHPAHARKMVARLEESGHDVSYYENIEGGHGAAADNEQRALKWALVFEFLWRHLAG